MIIFNDQNTNFDQDLHLFLNYVSVSSVASNFKVFKVWSVKTLIKPSFVDWLFLKVWILEAIYFSVLTEHHRHRNFKSFKILPFSMTWEPWKEMRTESFFHVIPEYDFSIRLFDHWKRLISLVWSRFLSQHMLEESGYSLTHFFLKFYKKNFSFESSI